MDPTQNLLDLLCAMNRYHQSQGASRRTARYDTIEALTILTEWIEMGGDMPNLIIAREYLENIPG